MTGARRRPSIATRLSRSPRSPTRRTIGSASQRRLPLASRLANASLLARRSRRPCHFPHVSRSDLRHRPCRHPERDGNDARCGLRQQPAQREARCARSFERGRRESASTLGAIVTRQAGGDVAASCTRRRAGRHARRDDDRPLIGMAGGAVGLAVGAAIRPPPVARQTSTRRKVDGRSSPTSSARSGRQSALGADRRRRDGASERTSGGSAA